MLATTVKGEDGTERSGLDVFFLQDDKRTFKSTIVYAPYFYVAVENEAVTQDVVQFLARKFEPQSITVTPAQLEVRAMAGCEAPVLPYVHQLLSHSFRSLFVVGP